MTRVEHVIIPLKGQGRIIIGDELGEAFLEIETGPRGDKSSCSIDLTAEAAYHLIHAIQDEARRRRWPL